MKAENSPAGVSEIVPTIENTEQIIKWINEKVIGSYDYYVPYRLSSLEGFAFGSYVRIVSQRTSTTVTISGVGSFILGAGSMVEFDLPAGTHIRSDHPLTIQVYDDYWCDWDSLYLPPVQEWGRDYWYAGLRTFAAWPWPKEGEHYLFITSAFDGTRVEIDVNNDGIPEKTYDLNAGEAVAWGVQSVQVGVGPAAPWASYYVVEDDPRAGAHITSNNPIQVHAWATHEHYFGSGYLLLPTEALGTDYYVPFVPCSLPGPDWDDADRIKILSTADSTEVKIDEDNDGVPELTKIMNKGEILVYPEENKPVPFRSGTRVTSNNPVVVVYTSPGGIHYWDGGATQIVPKESALTGYWNTVSKDTYNYKNIHYYGDSYVLIYAFETNTVVNIDKNNDGIIDDTYTINPGTELKYRVFDSGYHIFSDKPISAYEVWWYSAGGEIELLGYRSWALPPPPEEWSFAIITDLHIGRGHPDYGGEGWNDKGTAPKEDYYLTIRLKNVVNWINENYKKPEYNIKFLVVLGDIADSGEYSELEKAKEILDTLLIPYLPVIGNHDVWSKVEGKQEIRDGDWYFINTFDEEFFENQFKRMGNVWWNNTDGNLLLHNYIFNYRGIDFIALDFIPRDPATIRTWRAFLHEETKAWLKKWLEDPLRQNPTVLLSHHPLAHVEPYEIDLSFEDDDLRRLKKEISGWEKVKANFAGHVHGYYTPEEPWALQIKNPYFMDANVQYPTPLNIPVIATEALMVASNDPKSEVSKGIIRIVKVKGSEIKTFIDGEFHALNPYFKEIEWELKVEYEYTFRYPFRKIKDAWWKVVFDVYAYTKHVPVDFSLYTGYDLQKLSGTQKWWWKWLALEGKYPKEGGTYELELMAENSTLGVKESISRKITIPSYKYALHASSPIDIVLMDPDGLITSKEMQEIPGTFYFETDIDDDGKIDDVIVFSDRKMGDYLITIIPEPNASLTDTYTLEFFAEDGSITVLAENTQIQNIPKLPYILRSIEKEFIPIIPATVDFDPNTLNLKSRGAWVTVYIELPLTHGYDFSMINLTSLMLNHQIQAEIKPIAIGDYDNDGIPDLMVKFNRAKLQNILPARNEVEIIITGTLLDGRMFEGKDTIRVILPP